MSIGTSTTNSGDLMDARTAGGVARTVANVEDVDRLFANSIGDFVPETPKDEVTGVARAVRAADVRRSA